MNAETPPATNASERELLTEAELLGDWNESAPYGEQMAALKLEEDFAKLVAGWAGKTADEIGESIAESEIGEPFEEIFSKIFMEGARYARLKDEDIHEERMAAVKRELAEARERLLSGEKTLEGWASAWAKDREKVKAQAEEIERLRTEILRAIDLIDNGYRPDDDYQAARILEKALAAQNPAGDVSPWMPIETAPRDWSNIILFLPENSNEVIQGYWDDDDECWKTSGAGMCVDANEICWPTLWMPLPKAPEQSAADGSGVGK